MLTVEWYDLILAVPAVVV